MANTNTKGTRWAPIENLSRASILMERIIHAPSGEPRMAILTGKPGLGKTFAAQYLQNRYEAYRIECNSVMNRKSLMISLLRDQMSITPAKTMPEMLEQIIIQMTDSERPLIIDEFDYLVDKGAIEIIRDIHDGSANCPILLIGEENLAQKLDKWERFSRRILDKVTVQPLSLIHI